MDNDILYHLGCKIGELHRESILFGDPDRCELMKELVDETHLVSKQRGFILYNGRSGKQMFTYGSLGIGGPSWVIGLHELVLAGVELFIRVGTSGIISPQVAPGSIVIPTKIISDESLSQYLIGSDEELKPANGLLKSLEQAANTAGIEYHRGIVHSKDFLYMEDPIEYPKKNELRKRMQDLAMQGVLVTEMECAALFAFGVARNYETGAVLAAINSDYELSKKTQETALYIALEALKHNKGDCNE